MRRLRSRCRGALRKFCVLTLASVPCASSVRAAEVSCNTSSIAAKPRRVSTQNLLANRSCSIMWYYLKFRIPILSGKVKKKGRTQRFVLWRLSKKYYYNFYASCGSTHKIEFAKQIHKFREHGPDHPLLPLCGNSPCVSRNLYKGRKNVPVGRGFSSVSLESVVSSERLFGKRSFSTVSKGRTKRFVLCFYSSSEIALRIAASCCSTASSRLLSSSGLLPLIASVSTALT